MRQVISLTTQLLLTQQKLAAQKTLPERGLARSGLVLALQRQEANLSGQWAQLAATKAQA